MSCRVVVCRSSAITLLGVSIIIRSMMHRAVVVFRRARAGKATEGVAPYGVMLGEAALAP